MNKHMHTNPFAVLVLTGANLCMAAKKAFRVSFHRDKTTIHGHRKLCCGILILAGFILLKPQSAQAETQQYIQLPEVTDQVPHARQGVSLAAALAWDILPGGGQFYLGNTWWGTGFAVSRTAALYSAWYYYRTWQYRGSVYHAAQHTQSSDPWHEILFKDPSGGEKTLQELENEYDRAAQHFTFAVIGNVVLISASMLKTWFDVQQINYRTIPAFNIGFSTTENGSGQLSAGFTYSF